VLTNFSEEKKAALKNLIAEKRTLTSLVYKLDNLLNKWLPLMIEINEISSSKNPLIHTKKLSDQAKTSKERAEELLLFFDGLNPSKCKKRGDLYKIIDMVEQTTNEEDLLKLKNEVKETYLTKGNWKKLFTREPMHMVRLPRPKG